MSDDDDQQTTMLELDREIIEARAQKKWQEIMDARYATQAPPTSNDQAPSSIEQSTQDQSSTQVGRPTSYNQEKADIIIATLEAGYRAYTAARRAGVSRPTLFNWKKAHPEFAQRWEHAVQTATDRIEEVVYDLALKGDLQACLWWLRAHRPEIYDKATLAKLGVLRAALEKGHAVIDADGIPNITPQQKTVIVIPDNKRGDRVIDVQSETVDPKPNGSDV